MYISMSISSFINNMQESMSIHIEYIHASICHPCVRRYFGLFIFLYSQNNVHRTVDSKALLLNDVSTLHKNEQYPCEFSFRN